MRVEKDERTKYRNGYHVKGESVSCLSSSVVVPEERSGVLIRKFVHLP